MQQQVEASGPMVPGLDEPTGYAYAMIDDKSK